MASATPRAVADLIHRLASRHASADTPDEELLRRFAATGDANAFELLLWRHERMVTGVCRRVLRNVHDAEDAFQATFLVLARKARAIAARRAVTTWLYTVAYRVALNARKERTRRLARVGPMPDGTKPVTPNQPGQPDVGGLLDEAVNSLPTRYRGPVVLCFLEGRSHAEAARLLGCAAGTVASRVARAKARLRAWLGRHGVRDPAGALAAGLGAAGTSSASARAVVSVTLQAARAVLAGAPCPAAVSPRVLVLAQGALDTMFRTRLLQILAVVLAAVVVWGAGWCLTGRDAPAAEPPPATQAPDPGRAEQPEKKTERSDVFGAPLPAGAVARLGSLRLYHDSEVGRVVLSPDGKTLASGGERKVVHLWDVSTRKELRTFDNPGGQTVCLAFSPDGQTLATRGAAESLVRSWDVAAGTQRREIGGLSAGSYRLLALGRPRLSFSPDNRTLAVNCDDGTVHLLDVTTGRESRVLGESQLAPAAGGGGPGGGPPGSPCLGVTFAPDGRSLAASYHASYNSDYNLWVRVWEVASGRERTRFKGHAGFVMVSAYSPDGTLLVTGGTDRTALVWDLFGLRTSDQKKADFTREDVDRLWADLADADAGKAFRAMQVLRANGAQAERFLKERLRPAAASDPKKIARLITDLDQDDFTARESATKQLSELGELAEPALRAALNDKPSADKRSRVENLLKRLDASNSPELLRGMRAVEVLESLDTPEARQVLHALAQGAAEARLTREAKAAQERRKR